MTSLAYAAADSSIRKGFQIGKRRNQQKQKNGDYISMKSTSLFIFITFFPILACMRHDLGSAPKMGAEYPHCKRPLSSISEEFNDSEELFFKTPFASANQFDTALFAEVQRVLKTGNDEEKRGLDAFFDPSCLELAPSKDSSFAATFREQFNLDPATLGQILVDSELRPATAKRPGNNMFSVGGVVFVRGDLFPEGYYRGRYYADSRGNGLESWATMDHMLNQTPWFELDRANKRYVFRTTGSAKKMVDHLVTLSGTSEITFFHGGVAEDLNRPQADDQYLEKSILQPNMFFVTPDFKAASGEFAKSMVARLQIPKEEVVEAIESNNAYIGLEFEYFELAFFNSPESHKIVKKYAKPYCYVGEVPLSGLTSCDQFRRDD